MKRINLVKFMLTCAITCFFSPIMPSPGFADDPLKTNHGTVIRPKKIKGSQAIKTAWPEIEFQSITTNEQTDKTWRFSIIVKNHGPRLQANRILVQGFQAAAGKKLSTAGEPMKYNQGLQKDGIMRLGIGGWARIQMATQLVIELKDLQTGRKASKTVAMTNSNAVVSQNSDTINQIEQMDSDALTNPTSSFRFTGTEYMGRGFVRVKIKNTGNIGIAKDQLRFTPMYFPDSRPGVLGDKSTNPAPLAPGKERWYIIGGGGIYYKGWAECWMLSRMGVSALNSRTRRVTQTFFSVPKPAGNIRGVNMSWSHMSIFLENTGSFKTKYKVMLRNMQVKRYRYNNDKFGEEVGKVTDTFLSTITIDPGQRKSLEINSDTMNAIIKRALPGLGDTFYLADFIKIDLYLTDDNPYCASGGRILGQFTRRDPGKDAIFFSD